MSPQGRKRASAMVARDFRTVSGIGQSYHNNNQTFVVRRHLALLAVCIAMEIEWHSHVNCIFIVN